DGEGNLLDENHLNGDLNQNASESTEDENYEPGETVSRPMGIACMLLLLFFVLISCGFVISVLSAHH
ncbi:MAG TPA: hypothetical protein VKX96_10855, partial [Chloroflexota bacterium]|nr:hypothetical protein [Chloroflexota bacterium]